MYQLLAYIKFLVISTNQHGVHSPFIYNFVTKCLYGKTKHHAYTKLYNYRKTLQSSDSTINIKDLGEGSRVLSAHQRAVRKMINTSSSSKKDSELLYRFSKYFRFKNSLELGTSLGMGTYAMSLANPASKVITIEGCPNTSKFSKSQLERLDVKNVDFLIGRFSENIPKLKEAHYDFIFFDGHHNKDATIQYFEALLPKIHNDTVFVFDDIYWSKDMTEAWEFIKAHDLVTVTVDCFHLGFVFFRKEQLKEHFRIRL